MDKKFYIELLEITNDSIELLKLYEREGESKIHPTELFSSIRSVAISCLDGNSINIDIKQDIPLKKQAEFSSNIFNLANFTTLNGGLNSNLGISNSLIKLREIIENIIFNKFHQSIKIQRIFYSWQSTLPNNTNRSLIKNSLEKALREINKDLSIEERIEIDSDTKNVAGSPDIIHTILSKIDNSDIFIADVSIVNGLSPNPNVMLELGYALKTLGDSKIIMIFNNAFGDMKDLPFDLGFKRQMVYCYDGNDGSSEIRKELTLKIKNAITTIMKNNSHE